MCLLRSLKRHSSSVEWEKVNVGRRSEWNLCHLNKTSVFSFNSDLTFLRHPRDRAGTLGCWWISHRHVNWTKGTFTNIYYSGVFFPSPLLQNCLPDDKQCRFFSKSKTQICQLQLTATPAGLSGSVRLRSAKVSLQSESRWNWCSCSFSSCHMDNLRQCFSHQGDTDLTHR